MTIAIRPPLVEGELRQAGDRVDLERGADAEQQVGAGAQSLRLLHRTARQELAEQDHVGLHLARAAGAGRDAVGVEQRLDLLQRVAGGAARAARGGDRAVHLDHPLRTRLAMQAIDVLGDHRVQQPAPLELGQRLVGGVRLLVGERLEAGPVEVPEAAWCRGGRRRSSRPTSGRPSPRAPSPGVRKSGIPDGTEIPAPVSATVHSLSRMSPASCSAAAREVACCCVDGISGSRLGRERRGVGGWVDGLTGLSDIRNAGGGRLSHRHVGQAGVPATRSPAPATSPTTSACACRGRPRSPRARPRSRTRWRSRPSPPRSPRPGRPSPRPS